jgi:hypothetical protein
MPDRAARPETELSETEIEITPAMIEAGLSKLYEFDITQPDPDELRIAVAAVYRAAHAVRHKSAS